jgi:hypothetical protein
LTAPRRYARDIPHLGLTYEEACKARLWFTEQSGGLGEHAAIECREWQGPRNRAGYGIAKFKGRTYAAHRLCWLLFKSDIPPELVVCHHCDNPACVEPHHLFLATNQDNIWDAVRKGRYGINSKRKRRISFKQVLAYRRMVRLFKTSATEVARVRAERAGLSVPGLYAAIVGHTYGYLPNAVYRHDDPRDDLPEAA